MAGMVELTPPSVWDVIIFLVTFPFALFAIFILIAIYLYYACAVPNLMWRCFAKIGLKTKPPSKPFIL